jgi:hypothetical protein
MEVHIGKTRKKSEKFSECIGLQKKICNTCVVGNVKGKKIQGGIKKVFEESRLGL